MGYASYESGYRGIVQEREYNTLLAVDIVPAVIVDGKPTSWRRNVWVGAVVETVKEVVGLSYSLAHSRTASVGGVTLSSATTYSSGSNPIETYSRQIERIKDGDSDLWSVRIIERTCTPTLHGE